MEQVQKDIAIARLEEVLEHQTWLYEHQTEAAYGVVEDLREKNATYLDMATGSGKTDTFTTIAMGMGLDFMVLTPRQGLNRHSEKTLKRLGMISEEFGVYDATRKQTEKKLALAARGLITSYDSFIDLAKDGRVTPENRPLLILDEMQRATGEEREKYLAPFFERALVVGCSATPGRAVRLFGDRPPAYHLKLREGILRGGILCQGLKTAAMEIQIDLREFAAYSWDSDIPQATLEKIANDDGMINSAIHFYATHHDDDIGQIYGKPTILFTCGVAAAHKAAKRFNQHFGEELAVVISGKTPTRERHRIEERFKRGEIKILCNAELLIEGFDAPHAQICLSLRPTYMAWVSGQQLGRITRLFGNKISLAVNFFPRGIKPVLFAEILEEAAMYSPTAVRSMGETKKSVAVQELTDIILPNFTLYSSYEEMAKILCEMQAMHVAGQCVSLIPEGWESGHSLMTVYLGGNAELVRKIAIYREEKIAAEMALGTPREEAEQRISEIYVKSYRKGGHKTWHISAAGRIELEDRGQFRRRETKAPPAPKRWGSGNSLRAMYVGSNETLNQIIERYREEKISAEITLGLPAEEAERKVSTVYVGVYSKGGQEAWYVSPDGMVELEAIGRFQRLETRPPLPPEGWATGHSLKDLYVGAPRKLDQEIQSYREKKITEVMALGTSKEAAEEQVSEVYVRFCSRKARDAWCISPDGRRALEAAGVLKRKSMVIAISKNDGPNSLEP